MITTIIGTIILGFISILCIYDSYKGQMALNRITKKVNEQENKLNKVKNEREQKQNSLHL